MGSAVEDPKRYFAYNIFIKKLPDQTSEAHHAHIENINTPIIKPLLKKYGIVSYTITHNDSTAKSLQERLFAGAPEHMWLNDYDTMISIVAPSVENIKEMQKDPDFLGRFVPDHFNFADMGAGKTIVGWAQHYTF